MRADVWTRAPRCEATHTVLLQYKTTDWRTRLFVAAQSKHLKLWKIRYFILTRVRRLCVAARCFITDMRVMLT